VIDPAVGNPTERQECVGLAGALDARPAVEWIVLRQIRQLLVDGVGVDVDDPCGGAWMSVDGSSPSK